MGAINRRQAFVLGGGFVALTVMPMAANAEPSNDAAELIKTFTGGKEAAKGKIALDLPEIAENGNTVPMTVSVDHPMTAESHVKSIHVFNEKNPQPNVANFHLTPQAGRAQVATRIRLADTQKVVAIAKLSDGSFWSVSVDVIVTLAACTEEMP